MTEEIIDLDSVIVQQNGKEYIHVLISNDALSQINKIILEDNVDKDDPKAVALREQVHQDCLRLFKRFN